MPDFAASRTMMVDTQVRPSDVTKYPLIEAMLSVPREEFVPDARRSVAYSGGNLPLAPGRVLLEPRTLAKMIEVLDVQPDELAMDLGCGYGYSAAVLAQLVVAVVAVEEDDELVREAETRLGAAGIDNVAVVRNPLRAGYEKQGPYDAILVSGGAVEEIPSQLTDQLKERGRIIALFQQGNLGVARVGIKLNGQMNWRYAFNASAPLLPGFAVAHRFAL